MKRLLALTRLAPTATSVLGRGVTRASAETLLAFVPSGPGVRLRPLGDFARPTLRGIAISLPMSKRVRLIFGPTPSGAYGHRPACRAAFALLLWGRPTAARDQRRWSSRMRPYEVMVIFDPDTEERSVQPTLEQYLTVITKGGGTVDSLDIWGRRRLAYEIRTKSEGIYAVINLTANPADVKELDRQFTISEQIMRTKVIRPDLH